MTVESAEGTPFEGLLGQPEEQAGGIRREDDLLCLLLLYHKHVLAERSPFWKHIQALPREYHQTIHYTGVHLSSSIKSFFHFIGAPAAVHFFFCQAFFFASCW